MSAEGLQWVLVGLGVPTSISCIKLWYYFGYQRLYHDVIVQVSNDLTFSTGVMTVYKNDTNGSAGMGTGTDSEYSETTSGLSVISKTGAAQYVRFYSNGNSVNNYNHYCEIEVYS